MKTYGEIKPKRRDRAHYKAEQVPQRSVRLGDCELRILEDLKQVQGLTYSETIRASLRIAWKMYENEGVRVFDSVYKEDDDPINIPASQ